MTKRIERRMALEGMLNKDEMQYLEDALVVVEVNCLKNAAVDFEDWSKGGKFFKPRYGVDDIGSPIPHRVFKIIQYSFKEYRYFRNDYLNSVDWEEYDKGLYDRHICMDPDTRDRLESAIIDVLDEMDTEFREMAFLDRVDRMDTKSKKNRRW